MCFRDVSKVFQRLPSFEVNAGDAFRDSHVHLPRERWWNASLQLMPGRHDLHRHLGDAFTVQLPLWVRCAPKQPVSQRFAVCLKTRGISWHIIMFKSGLFGSFWRIPHCWSHPTRSSAYFLWNWQELMICFRLLKDLLECSHSLRDTCK